MSVWGESVTSILNRVKDIQIYSDTGNNVENYALDLLNRAQNWLCMYKQWDYLKKEVELTVDSDRIAQLPSDINVLIDVYDKVGGLGKPSRHYYPDAVDVSQRCELRCAFNTTTGHSWTLSFPSTALLSGQLYLLYMYNLADIAESDTYTFFPGELLVRCAQKIHIEDKGLTGDTANLAIQAFNDQLRNFETNSQYVNHKMDLTIKNRWGDPLRLPGHRLDGQNSYGTGPYPPSTYFVI